MPWRVRDAMSERLDLVTLAGQPGADMAELCRRLGVSRKTGCKWLKRFGAVGSEGLVDRSRRPKVSPRRTVAAVEAAALDLRRAQPAGGERCFPLTVLDDHSRYRLGAQACRDERDATVRERLTRVFERHGLPGAMITDNGNPPAPEAWRATEGFDQALGLADPPRHRALVEPPPC